MCPANCLQIKLEFDFHREARVMDKIAGDLKVSPRHLQALYALSSSVMCPAKHKMLERTLPAAVAYTRKAFADAP